MSHAAAEYVTLSSMRLLTRDLQVVRAVGRFGQLTTSHIRTLLFHDRDQRVCTRVLVRLVNEGLLTRIEKRVPGGSQGGSAQYCYQLGSVGWDILNGTRWRPMRVISYHRLAVADVYCALLELSRDGEVRINADQVETEAWRLVDGAEIRPDLYVEVDNLERQTRRVLAVEVDLGTERVKQIHEKLDRYTHARRHDNGRQYPVFPDVVFATIDDRRKRDLEDMIRRHHGENIFSVCLLDEFPDLLR